MIQWQPPPESHQNGPLQGYIIRWEISGTVFYTIKLLSAALHLLEYTGPRLLLAPLEPIVSSQRELLFLSLKSHGADAFALSHTVPTMALRYCLSGLPVDCQMKNITNPDQTNLLLEDLIIWTNYEIEVAAYNGAGQGVYSPKVTEWTLQGGEYLISMDLKFDSILNILDDLLFYYIN